MSEKKIKAKRYLTAVAILSVSAGAAIFTIVSMKLSGMKIRTEMSTNGSIASVAEVSTDRQGKILPGIYNNVKIAVFPKEKCESMIVVLQALGDVQLNSMTNYRHDPCDEVILPIEVKIEEGGYGKVVVDIEYESAKGTIRGTVAFPYYTSSTNLEKHEAN